MKSKPIFTAAFMSACLYTSAFNLENNREFPPDSVPKVVTLADFTLASKAATPTVVHIKTYSRYAAQQQYNMGPLEDFFKDFYGGQPLPQEQDSEPELLASGSGVIISNDGYIITNNHITEDAERIEVVLNDKRAYNATLIGTDPSTDIALIKVEASDLPAIQYGNSSEIQVGDWVLAVGNPFNLTSTVTAGIVSATGRNINILGGDNNMAIESFIQTDAAVNPGNSGGALVDLTGKLIGINTAIASPTGAFTGYSFAVPVNLVKKVVNDLMLYRQVQRGLLGVLIRELNADLARQKGIENLRGVYVEKVNENSAAQAAGLKPGDIITVIDGIEVNNPAQLQEIVALNRPGDTITVQYRRNGKPREANAILRSKTGSTELVKYDPNKMENKVGADFEEVDKDLLQKLGLPGGVKVADIKFGKFREAGIREGFIITHIDKKKVDSIKEARSIIEKSKGGGVLIEGVYPNGEEAFYAVGF